MQPANEETREWVAQASAFGEGNEKGKGVKKNFIFFKKKLARIKILYIFAVPFRTRKGNKVKRSVAESDFRILQNKFFERLGKKETA